MMEMEPNQIPLVKEDIEIPAPIKNRVPTNVKFLLALKVVLVSLLPLVIYTLCYSDIDRYGAYDQCGNICGMKNAKYDQWNCTGKDFTDKKFLQFNGYVDLEYINLVSRQCVSKCDPYERYWELPPGLCFKEGSFKKSDIETLLWLVGLGDFLQFVAWRLTFACFLSIGVALAMMFLLRMAPVIMVWGILSGGTTLLIIMTCLLWGRYFLGNVRDGFIIFPIFFTVIAIIFVAIVVFLYKKVHFIIVIFKEAMKVTYNIPQILLAPLLTFLMQLLVVALFVTVLVYMLSSGVLTEIKKGFLDYESNIVMNLTTILTFSTLCWVSQFILGIQYMIVAGAVSKWYFTKDKNNLGDAIATSATVVYKFHLGSIAFGSLIITIMAIVRVILSSLLKIKFLRTCFEFYISLIEEFLKYLSKNAYIMTAMHGKPFFESGKKAAQILYQNLTNTVLINFVGDYIMVMAYVLVMLISWLFTYFIMQDIYTHHVWSVYYIVGFVSLMAAYICLSIFETIIDTMFLCICEDQSMNDGVVRPYAMSSDLMMHFQNFFDRREKIDADQRL